MEDGEVRYKTTGCADENTMPGLDVIRRLTYVGFSMFDRYVPSLLSILYGGKTPTEAIAEAEKDMPLKNSDFSQGGLFPLAHAREGWRWPSSFFARRLPRAPLFPSLREALFSMFRQLFQNLSLRFSLLALGQNQVFCRHRGRCPWSLS